MTHVHHVRRRRRPKSVESARKDQCQSRSRRRLHRSRCPAYTRVRPRRFRRAVRSGRCACARGYGGGGAGDRRPAGLQRPRRVQLRPTAAAVCACEDGRRGAACEEARCPADCAGRGRCVDGRCGGVAGATAPAAAARDPVRARYLQCDDVALRLRGGLRGAACDEAEAACVAGGCGGAGVCAGGACRCTGGYFGLRCEQRLRRRLRRPGDCVDGACVCAAGWSARLRGARLPGHAAVLGARPLPRRRVRLPRGLLGRRLLRRAGCDGGSVMRDANV